VGAHLWQVPLGMLSFVEAGLVPRTSVLSSKLRRLVPQHPKTVCDAPSQSILQGNI
jgi:hypothetical protein